MQPTASVTVKEYIPEQRLIILFCVELSLHRYETGPLDELALTNTHPSQAEEDEFSMHTMWDKDGKPHDAKTKADHERMKKLGWSHENPRHNPYNPDEDVKEVSAMQRRARKAAYAKKTMKKYGDAAKMGIDAKDVNQRRNAPTRKKS